jgi:hypothetical protein
MGEAGPKGELGKTGEAGPKGELGKTGEAGPKGELGKTGEKGPIGQCGVNGKVGENGEKGEKGKNGENGEKGEKGEKGEMGEMGEKGEKGEKGEMGEMGEKGEKGNTGLRGRSSYLSVVPINLNTDLDAYISAELECYTSHNQQLFFQGYITIKEPENIPVDTIVLCSTRYSYTPLLANCESVCQCYLLDTHDTMGHVSYNYTSGTVQLHILPNVTLTINSCLYFELRSMIDDIE